MPDRMRRSTLASLFSSSLFVKLSGIAIQSLASRTWIRHHIYRLKRLLSYIISYPYYLCFSNLIGPAASRSFCHSGTIHCWSTVIDRPAGATRIFRLYRAPTTTTVLATEPPVVKLYFLSTIVVTCNIGLLFITFY